MDADSLAIITPVLAWPQPSTAETAPEPTDTALGVPPRTPIEAYQDRSWPPPPGSE